MVVVLQTGSKMEVLATLLDCLFEEHQVCALEQEVGMQLGQALWLSKLKFEQVGL
jgi:hypothetical protein